MKQLLLFLYGISLVLGLSSTSETYAQGEQKRSRLDIKPKAKTATGSQYINSYFYPKVETSREVKLSTSTAVNEYYRTLLRNRPKASAALKSDQPLAMAAVVATEPSQESEKNSIEDIYSSSTISVSPLFPNPASDYVDIKYTVAANAGQAKLVIYSPVGVQVGNHVLDPSERKMRISTANLPNNIYFYQISLDDKTLVTKKLIVRHQ